MGSLRKHPDLPSAAAVTVAIVAVSSSASLIVFAAAPALALAFWRNALAAAVLTPVAAARRRAELRAVFRGARRRDGLLCVLAGVALAAHFGTWMSSVQLTTVATAVALGATQPVWQALIAARQGHRPTLLGWAGIGLAVVGTGWATGADLTVSPRAVAGDALAVVGGLAAAVYTAFGERARARLSTTTYTWICYGSCAAVLAAVCAAAGVRLTGYPASTWAAILGLVLGAQLLGHSLFNYALRRVSATTVSVLVLLEVPGAALLAWWWLEQQPRTAALPGLVLLLVGVAVVVRGARLAAAPGGDGARTGPPRRGGDATEPERPPSR